jgi:DNA-binding CsgD family transcriptional regulator
MHSTTRPPSHAGARRKDTLARRLALAKLRELKREGWTYREIGLRFRDPSAGEAGHGAPARHPGRGPVPQRGGPDPPPLGDDGDDTQLFLRALDALDQGLGFFGERGELLNANRRLEEMLVEGGEGGAGDRLEAELRHFADALWRLARLRGISHASSVQELAAQEVPLDPGSLVLKGSYIGLDLFGTGPLVLIAVERPPDDPLSPESLRARFELTRQECRIATLLADGSSNADIAAQLHLSPHTIRRHTENVLRKLGVRSRAEAVARILRVS